MALIHHISIVILQYCLLSVHIKMHCKKNLKKKMQCDCRANKNSHTCKLIKLFSCIGSSQMLPASPLSFSAFQSGPFNSLYPFLSSTGS